MGDFNDIRSKTLDQSKEDSKRTRMLLLLTKLEKSTEEECEAYSMKLDKMLKEKLAASSEEDSIVIQSEKKNIDELWDIIVGCILSSAYKMLPSKEIKIGTCLPKN